MLCSSQPGHDLCHWNREAGGPHVGTVQRVAPGARAVSGALQRCAPRGRTVGADETTGRMTGTAVEEASGRTGDALGFETNAVACTVDASC